VHISVWGIKVGFDAWLFMECKLHLATLATLEYSVWQQLKTEELLITRTSQALYRQTGC